MGKLIGVAAAATQNQARLDGIDHLPGCSHDSLVGRKSLPELLAQVPHIHELIGLVGLRIPVREQDLLVVHVLLQQRRAEPTETFGDVSNARYTQGRRDRRNVPPSRRMPRSASRNNGR